MRWFYEGRKKDVPEPYPLPSDFVSNYGEGLQTPSGKYEFIPTTLKRFDDPERPPLNRYMRTFENPQNNPEPQAIMPVYLYLMGPDSTGVNGQAFNAQ